MRNNDIPDNEIPTADPEQVIRQYEPLIKKVAYRYKAAMSRSGVYDIDDLMQAGRIALLKAKEKYDPERGCTFTNFCFNYLRKEMWETLNINPNTGEAPKAMIYLDTIIGGEDEGTALGNLFPDPRVNILGRIIAEETQAEIKLEVHEAVERLKNEKQRIAVKRLCLDEADRKTVAEELRIPVSSLSSIVNYGKQNLRQDYRLKLFAKPRFHVSAKAFRSSWTSAVEAEILWKENQFEKQYGEGSYIRKGKEAEQ